MTTAAQSTHLLVSVIIPCRNEETTIAATLQAALAQESADHQPMREWAEILVVDDESSDKTPEILAKIAADHPHVRVLRNEPRRGLSGSYNRALEQARAETVVLCHADCQMYGNNYLWHMTEHFQNPKVGAVTGKPIIPGMKKLSFVEKTYIVSHLMDVEEEPEITREINFAEGRCDGFRKKAVEIAGRYDEKTKISGEDQVMAMALRKQGLSILQDTSLRYTLSAGSSQNTSSRIIYRQIVLARSQAFVFFKHGFETSKLAETVPNRAQRKRLRMIQIVYPPLLLATLVILAILFPVGIPAVLGAFLVIRFIYLLAYGLPRASFVDLLRMFPVIIACDWAYCYGFLEGAYLTKTGKIIK